MPENGKRGVVTEIWTDDDLGPMVGVQFDGYPFPISYWPIHIRKVKSKTPRLH